jgi:hypothetical protein
VSEQVLRHLDEVSVGEAVQPPREYFFISDEQVCEVQHFFGH